MPHFPVWLFLLLLQDLQDRWGALLHLKSENATQPLPGEQNPVIYCQVRKEKGADARVGREHAGASSGSALAEGSLLGRKGFGGEPRLPGELKLLNRHVLALPRFHSVSLASENALVAGSRVRAPDLPLLFYILYHFWQT